VRERVLLELLAVDRAPDAARRRIAELIRRDDPRAKGQEGVEALAQQPLGPWLLELPIACRHVVADRVASHMLKRLCGFDVPAAAPCRRERSVQLASQPGLSKLLAITRSASTSSAPSKMLSTRASTKYRETSVSSAYPIPPWSCMASRVTRSAAREA